MKLKIILIVISILLLVGNIFSGYKCWKTDKTNKEHFSLIEKQSATIDSLVNNPATSIKLDVSMQLTDKSKFEISAKNNQGTITAPSDKSYTLEVKLDSVTAYINK